MVFSISNACYNKCLNKETPCCDVKINPCSKVLDVILCIALYTLGLLGMCGVIPLPVAVNYLFVAVGFVELCVMSWILSNDCFDCLGCKVPKNPTHLSD